MPIAISTGYCEKDQNEINPSVKVFWEPLMKLTYHEKPNVDDIMNLIRDLDQALLDAKAVDLESVNDILMRD